jgi:hypothetical protein
MMLTEIEETNVLELCEQIKFNKDMELVFEDYFNNRNKKSILKMYQYENKQGENYFCLFDEHKIETICFVLGMIASIMPNNLDSQERKSFNIYTKINLFEIFRIFHVSKESKYYDNINFKNRVINIADCSSSSETMNYITNELKFYLDDIKMPFNFIDLINDLLRIDKDDFQVFNKWIVKEFFDKRYKKQNNEE